MHEINKVQARDTGMAMVLLVLLFYLFTGYDKLVPLATGLLLLNMIWPGAYRPVARIWLGVSYIMGAVMSRFLLSVLFFLLVTPVGLIRRMCKADTLQLRQWKNNNDSVFKVREHTYSATDLKQPY